MTPVHRPERPQDRRYAEHCQYGDVVRWPAPPRVQRGVHVSPGPSRTGVVVSFIGPAPVVALVRFALDDGGESEPLVVCVGQPLTVTDARK